MRFSFTKRKSLAYHPGWQANTCCMIRAEAIRMNILNALKREQKKLARKLERIQGAITALGGKGRGRKKRRMSAAVKRRISRAQKANWREKRMGK
jgi:hypothetical protein